jgi:hypothetical protein
MQHRLDTANTAYWVCLVFSIRPNVTFHPITEFFPDSKSAVFISDDFAWMIRDLVAGSEDVRAEASKSADCVAEEVRWLIQFSRGRPHALLAEYVVTEGDAEEGRTLHVLISRSSIGVPLLGAVSDSMPS